MAERLKKLKIYGIMYFLFGVINAVSMLWGVGNGRYSAILLVEGGSISERNAILFEVLAFVIAVVVILSYLCIGMKGYTYGIGEGYGMVHILVSKYLIYALVLQILVNIRGFLVGQADYIAIVTAIIGAVFIFNYSKYARIALES